MTSWGDWIDRWNYGAVSFSDLPRSLQEDTRCLAEAMEKKSFVLDRYRELPFHLKRDREICTAVIQHVILPLDNDIVEFIFAEAAPALVGCPFFWKAVFEGSEYTQIYRRYAPPAIRHNIDFMLNVNCHHGHVMWDLTDPLLRDNPSFVAAVRQFFKDSLQYAFPRDHDDSYHQRLLFASPPFIKDDRELAKLALGYTEDCAYSMLSARLQRDEEIIAMAIEGGDGYSVLSTLPVDFLRANVQVVKHYLHKGVDISEAKHLLPEEMWEDQEIVSLFLQNGGEPHDGMPPEHMESIDMCSILLKATSKAEFNPWSYIRLSSHEFFERIALNGITFAADLHRRRADIYSTFPLNTPDNLWYSFYWKLRTVYHSRTSADPPLSVLPKSMRMRFAFDVSDELWVFRTFSSTVLLAMGVHREPPLKRKSLAATCQLSKLDGCTCIKQMIADYVGVPTGISLTMLRRVEPVCDRYLFSTILSGE